MKLLYSFSILLIVSACVPQAEESSELYFQNLKNSGSNFKKEEYISATKVRTGDRFYVANVFANIFGPTSVTPVTNNIIKKMSEFGGPCSVQEASKLEQSTYGDVGMGTYNEFYCPKESNAF